MGRQDYELRHRILIWPTCCPQCSTIPRLAQLNAGSSICSRTILLPRTGWSCIRWAFRRRGTKPYGEVDFVVLIPRGGVFCLEVKGGRIACRDGEWETTDRNGQVERLRRSPFLQARECMFAVRDSVLTRAPYGFPAGVVYGYGVIMPDISFQERSPEWEPWQAIDRDAMARSIAAPLTRLAAEHRKLIGTPPLLNQRLQRSERSVSF